MERRIGLIKDGVAENLIYAQRFEWIESIALFVRVSFGVAYHLCISN